MSPMPWSVRWLLGSAVAAGLAGLLLSLVPPGQVPPKAISVLFVAGAVLAFLALLRGGQADACGSAPPALRRRDTRELMLAMAGYVLVLFASVWLLKRVEEPVLRALLALAPVPPIALAMRAIVRYIRDVDEMQQRIELEAVCIATAFVSLLYLAGGFLQAARVIDLPAAAAMIWLFPLVCFSYGLAKIAVVRRYR